MAPIPVNLTYKGQVMSTGQRKAHFGIFIAKKKLPHNSRLAVLLTPPSGWTECTSAGRH